MAKHELPALVLSPAIGDSLLGLSCYLVLGTACNELGYQGFAFLVFELDEGSMARRNADIVGAGSVEPIFLIIRIIELVNLFVRVIDLLW